MREHPLLQLASNQSRCFSLAGDGTWKLELHAHLSPDARWNQQLNGANGVLTLEAAIGGRRVPIEILVDDGLELSAMHDVVLEIDFGAWRDIPGRPLPAGLLRLNVWSGTADGSSRLGTKQLLPDVLLSSESILMVPKIWAAAVPEVAQAVWDLEAAASMQPTSPSDASPAPHVFLLSDLALVIEAALERESDGTEEDGCTEVLSRWEREAAAPPDPPSPLRRAYLEGVLRTAGDMAHRLGASGFHSTARMLGGCSRLLEMKLGSGEEDECVGTSNVAAPETIACDISPAHGAAGAGGLSFSTSPLPLSADFIRERAPDPEPEMACGVSVAWAIAVIISSCISAVYQLFWLGVSK